MWRGYIVWVSRMSRGSGSAIRDDAGRDGLIVCWRSKVRRGFVEVDTHDEEEFGEFEGFADEEASLEAHAVELPVVTTGDDDDGGVAGAVMAAQDFVEGGTIEVGETDVEQDEVGLEVGNALEGLLAVVEEGEAPVGVVFEGIMKKPGELGVVFDDGDDFGGWLGIV